MPPRRSVICSQSSEGQAYQPKEMAQQLSQERSWAIGKLLSLLTHLVGLASLDPPYIVT
ncbi:MAG: hypothetical protein HQ582_11075, partial [Planctomycetes bacterium]|nr:hypothetical protein [Planctomycetota bacterium]